MALSVADRLALSDLVHRYGCYVDDRRFDEVAELFTPTATLIVPDPPDRLAPTVRHHGTAGVRTAMTALHGIARTQHGIVGEVYTESAADAATGSITGVAHHWMADGDRVSDLVWYLRYADEYRRTEAGWRIAVRALSIDAVEIRTARQVRLD